MAYGIRKTLIFEHEKDDIDKEMKDTTYGIESLEASINEIEETMEAARLKDEGERETAEKKHKDDLQLIKKKNQRLKEELEKRLSV